VAILLDMVMPRMTSWEFLRERDVKHPELVDIPAIVFWVAGEVAPGTPPPRGLVRVLPKPADGGEVLAALSDLLDTLEQQGPGGEGTERAVGTSATSSVRDTWGEMSGFMRRYPLGMLCLGIGAGFLLSRVLGTRGTGR